MIPYGNVKTVSTQTKTNLKLIWESGPLTKRDLNIVSSDNTNVTGSMLFKKGKLEDIDQRSYFREVLFKDLDWSKDQREGRQHIERALANFTMFINGKYCGEWSLVVSHNTKKDSQAYLQRNSMSQLSWGQSIKFIANPKLIGASLKLYKGKGGRLVFVILIG
jgi:hypothetical protein